MNVEMSLCCEQVHAGRQTEEVLEIRQRPGLVKIVDAPDKASFGITPRAEVLNMQVTNRERRRALPRGRAVNLPSLDPAVERGAHEEKHVCAHLIVLEFQIAGDDRSAPRKPRFKVFRSLDNGGSLLHGLENDRRFSSRFRFFPSRAGPMP